MTEKLYEEKSYVSDFYACVLSCEKAEEGYKITLNKTAFFPEGGGQCCDTGMINGVEVFNVQIENGEIYHYVYEEVEVNKEVHCLIDWPKRFRNMQNHSGEHLFSGIVKSLFGLNNIGFHLGEKDVTIDYDGELTAEEVKQAENMANKAVSENVSINSWYPPAEILPEIEYRSKLDLTENVRIVRIAGYDTCACCAPHVKFTGEIGVIKIVDHYRQNKHTRLRMLCGKDALEHYETVYANISDIAKMISAQCTNVSTRVQIILNNYMECKKTLQLTATKLAEITADAIDETDRNIVLFFSDLNFNALRRIANKIVSKSEQVVLTLSGDDENGYDFVAASRQVDLLRTAKFLQLRFNAKCGGSQIMIQGHINGTKREIQSYFP